MEKAATELMRKHYATTRASAAARDWKHRITPEEREAFVAGAMWASGEIANNFDLKPRDIEGLEEMLRGLGNGA